MKKIATIISILCLGLMACPLAFAAVNDGLVAYWPVEGNLIDESGNEHNGTGLNGGAGITYEQGKLGQCVTFDGQWGHGVDTGTWSPNVHNGPFSVACWARWRTGGASQWQGLVGKRDQWNNTADTPTENNRRGYWYLEFSHDNATPQTAQNLYFQSPQDGPWQNAKKLISGQWQFVVGTFQNGNAILYLDGQQIASGGMNLDERDFNNHLVFGCVGFDGASNIENPFSGSLDEIAIWNRALSAAEVAELYNNGEGMILGGNQWKATEPVPADGAIGIPVDADLALQWSPPAETPPQPITMYDIYFGTDKEAVKDPNLLNPLRLGTVTLPGDLKWMIPSAQLQRDMTYYWRVDALIDRNEPNIAFGKVWSFETQKSIPVVLTQPVDQLVEENASASFTVTIESPIPYTVNWYRVGDNAPMGSGETLTIPAVDKTNWGDKYYCIPTNANGVGGASNAAGAYFKTLVAHYKCDEDVSINKLVADSSGLKNKHDATAMSTTASAAGLYAGALSFNGTSDWVNCGTWNPTEVTGQMTVSFWSKWGGSNTSWQGFIGKRDDWGAANMMWSLTCHAQNEGRIGIESDGAWPWFGPTEVRVLPVDQWSHVAVTFNGSAAELFINGHRVADPQPFTMNGKTDSAVVFGATGFGGDDPYKGLLDDVRFYNYVLTPLEIGEMAAAGLGRPVCPVYHPYDYDQDCYVDLEDFVHFMSNWTECNVVPDCR